METIDWHDKWILLVEDDQSSAEYLFELLSRAKVNIIHAENGEQAIRQFRENMDKIDVVLMDIQLPDINGVEITKRMKGLKNTVKVIAQTAFALVTDKNKFLNEGFDDYISKPILGKILMEKLSSYL